MCNMSDSSWTPGFEWVINNPLKVEIANKSLKKKLTKKTELKPIKGKILINWIKTTNWNKIVCN